MARREPSYPPLEGGDIDDFGFARAAKKYDTISLLKAQDMTNVNDNDRAGVKTVGEKGPSVYFYDPDSSETADGEDVVEPDSGGGRWIRSTDIRDVGRKVTDISDLVGDTPTWIETAFSSIPKRDVLGFYNKGDGGGDTFYWDADKDKADHNGGTIINPDHNSTIGSDNWYDATGDSTDTTGSGCWVREDTNKIYVRGFGVVDDDSDQNKAFLTALQQSNLSKPCIIEDIDVKISPITFPNSCYLIIADNSNIEPVSSTTTGDFITLGPDNKVENLRINIPTGYTTDRLVTSSSNGVEIEKANIESVDQLAEEGARFLGDNNVFKDINIKNINSGFTLVGDNHKLTNLTVENYKRALYLKTVTNSEIREYSCSGRSGSIIETGKDGILIEECSDLDIYNPIIKNPPEHGIYVSSTANNGSNDNINIYNPLVIKAGNNGIKLLGTENNSVNIFNPTVIDANELGGNGIGYNISNAKKCVITNPVVKNEEFTYSCSDGMVISGCANLEVTNIIIRNHKDEGITFSGNDGANDNIRLLSGLIKKVDDFADHNGIGINRTGNQDNIYIRGIESSGHRYGLQIFNSTGTFTNVNIIGGDYTNNNFDISYNDSLGSEVTLDYPKTNSSNFQCTIGSRWYDSGNNLSWEKWKNPTTGGGGQRSLLRGIRYSTTASRPASGDHTGDFYFDTTEGKPVWWDGSNWVDATGTTV